MFALRMQARQPGVFPPCPACKKPLHGAYTPAWVNGGQAKYEVWCGYGPCPGQASNNGAEGATLEEAVQRLADDIDNE